MTEFFYTKHAKQVFCDLSQLKSKEQLETKLTAIAVKGGLNYNKAVQAAKDILEVFQTHETVLRDLTTAADQALDKFFKRLDSSYAREETLGHLYTSLKLVDDPISRMRLYSAPLSEEMTQLWTQHHTHARENYEQVCNEVRDTLRRFNLSRQEMEKLLDGLDYFGIQPELYIAYKAEDIREHMARSAITAMHLYLDNQKELTPHQAALATCTIQDAAAFHDAVIAGRERMDAVKDGLWEWGVLYVALAVVVLLCGIPHPEEFSYFLILAAVLVVVGGVPALVSHPVGVWLGLAKVKVDNENRNQEQTHDEQTAFEDPTGLFDVHNYDAWDEMTDNAFVY